MSTIATAVKLIETELGGRIVTHVSVAGEPNRYGFSECPHCHTSPAYVIQLTRGVSDPWNDHDVCAQCRHTYASGSAVLR